MLISSEARMKAAVFLCFAVAVAAAAAMPPPGELDSVAHCISMLHFVGKCSCCFHNKLKATGVVYAFFFDI